MRLGILETPGHTPEGISILVYDLAKSRTAPQAVLTGETYPSEKRPGPVDAEASLAERTNTVFLGTSVRSGTARVLAVDLNHPERENWKEIIPQSQWNIESMTLTGGHIAINTLENVLPKTNLTGLKNCRGLPLYRNQRYPTDILAAVSKPR